MAQAVLCVPGPDHESHKAKKKRSGSVYPGRLAVFVYDSCPACLIFVRRPLGCPLLEDAVVAENEQGDDE